MDEVVQWIVWIAAGIAAGYVVVRAFWWLKSRFKIRQADERPLHSTRAVIWRDPGRVERLDLAAGPGGENGAPAPPLSYVEEHFGGSRPCVSVRDARGRTWRVKWGNEVEVETLATRLAWAAGYFVETTYFVAAGRIEDARDLKRAASCVDAQGQFRNARFELDEDNVIKHFDEHSWSWTENPFVGTRELNGLKIVMMWLSNWDAKDVHDVARGSNTAIFEYRTPRGEREARYLVIDWGGALGRWGNVVNRGRWDCAGFVEQTPHFVHGVDGEYLQWGYSGQRTADIAGGIRVSDAEWLLGYLGRLQYGQIDPAVRASGGTADDAACFARALIDRIDRLREIVERASPSGSPAALPSAVRRA